VAVLIGSCDESVDQDALRRQARKNFADVLIGIHGNRLICVLGFTDAPAPDFGKLASALEENFSPGVLVLGPVVHSVVEAHRSAKAALAGFAVAKAWTKAPRLINADDLLAERALAGDMLAKSTLLNKIYRPLGQASTELLDTLSAYLESGRSLENTARELFVHPNTVRYRLKRITEIIGWDATGSREAFVLQVAMVLGSMSETDSRKRVD
jgi:DNA-binding PucR family transcriptional regulator